MMKVLVTGKNGQLGFELARLIPINIDAKFYDSSVLNIANAEQVEEIISGEQPDIVINAAAYTAVDKAESESEIAFAVNATGCKNLAKACKKNDAKFIHVSTDFVFDGNSCKPYKPTDTTCPISVYGKSKLAGEQAIQNILPNDHVIIRTAWVYSTHGNNFVKTMLCLMQEKEQLGVVVDQVGTPTWAHGLAQAIWRQVKAPEKISGKLYHWSDAGVCSWYDFAVAIQESAIELGILTKAIPVKPIPGSAYPTPAARPHFSVLDKSDIETALGLVITHWQSQLKQMLASLNKGK